MVKAGRCGLTRLEESRLWVYNRKNAEIGYDGAEVLEMRWKGYEIEATVRKNCKRLILRSRPGEGKLCLSIPRGVSRREVEAFLAAHEGWIAEKAQSVPDWKPSYAAGERHRLFGEWVTLGENGVPVGQQALERWRAERLAQAVEPMICKGEVWLGVSCAGTRIRDMTSRWGSCQTVTRMITLNLRLARVPLACVEYVVAHEVCHLVHPDHSAAFYGELERMMPDWRERKKELNEFDLGAGAGNP